MMEQKNQANRYFSNGSQFSPVQKMRSRVWVFFAVESCSVSSVFHFLCGRWQEPLPSFWFAPSCFYEPRWESQRRKSNSVSCFPRVAKSTALLADLDERGLLDETLVVFLTEFGRTPKISNNGGRDHYPSSYSVAFAGGGVQGGQVYGKSDKISSKPIHKACEPAELHATIYDALGIPPDTHIHDRLGRPFPIADGEPLPLFS